MTGAEAIARRLDRRKFLLGAAGVAAGASAIGTFAQMAEAGVSRAGPAGPILPQAKPGESRVDLSGLGIPPPLDSIQNNIPGPAGQSTPFLQLPFEGFDVDPSQVGDFRGNLAYAIFTGEATGSDGNTYNMEFDLRLMAGRYIDVNGLEQRGAWGFF